MLSSPSEYLSVWSPSQLHPLQSPIAKRICARIGLLGNPSDGFNGRTLSSTISNFYASVTLIPSSAPDIKIRTNHLLDPLSFKNLDALSSTVGLDGYSGASCLFLAASRVLLLYMKQNKLVCPEKGYEILYDTSIPRQVGLAGSSALITSYLKCVIEYYGLEIDLDIQAELALLAETEELKCAAGLQDRVVQAYGGCVYMDFSGDRNVYKRVNMAKLSGICRGMWMAYVLRPKNSGKVHQNVRERWENGDEGVRMAMAKFAGIAQEGMSAIENRDRAGFARGMEMNFELRRAFYGDEVIGADNLKVRIDLTPLGCSSGESQWICCQV
jgi:glucuronokinase